MRREEIQAQLDRCCGPYPRPPLPRRQLTGIEKEERGQLEAIGDEYQREFGKATREGNLR